MSCRRDIVFGRSDYCTDSGLTYDKTLKFLNLGGNLASTRTTFQIANTNTTNKSSQIEYTDGAAILWSLGNDISLNGTQNFYFHDNPNSRTRDRVVKKLVSRDRSPSRIVRDVTTCAQCLVRRTYNALRHCRGWQKRRMAGK